MWRLHQQSRLVCLFALADSSEGFHFLPSRAPTSPPPQPLFVSPMAGISSITPYLHPQSWSVIFHIPYQVHQIQDDPMWQLSCVNEVARQPTWPPTESASLSYEVFHKFGFNAYIFCKLLYVCFCGILLEHPVFAHPYRNHQSLNIFSVCHGPLFDNHPRVIVKKDSKEKKPPFRSHLIQFPYILFLWWTCETSSLWKTVFMPRRVCWWWYPFCLRNVVLMSLILPHILSHS